MPDTTTPPEGTIFRADEFGVSFQVYRSAMDGKVVVHIDTDEEKLPCDSKGPTGLRVYMNDDTDNPLWNNPREEEKN